MKPAGRSSLLLVFVVSLVAAACKRTPPAPPPAEDRLVVVAGEALRDAFTTTLTDFNWTHRNVEVTFTFGAVHELRTALEHGAPADVVALCDETELGALERVHKLGAPVVFARDEAVVVVPSARSAKVKTFADLSPATRQRVVALLGAHERDTAATVAKVVAGETDAALVSRGAQRVLGDRVAVISLPPEVPALAKCAVAPATGAAHPRSAADWVAHVQSSVGQQTLRDAGFLSAGGSSTPARAPQDRFAR